MVSSHVPCAIGFSDKLVDAQAAEFLEAILSKIQRETTVIEAFDWGLAAYFRKSEKQATPYIHFKDEAIRNTWKLHT